MWPTVRILNQRERIFTQNVRITTVFLTNICIDKQSYTLNWAL